MSKQDVFINMTKETILRKAIEKAVKNGWEGNQASYFATGSIEPHRVHYLNNPNDIIFSHSFAKAFFGEELIEVGIGSETPVALQKAWRANLQKMVLERDPIKYLGKFL